MLGLRSLGRSLFAVLTLVLVSLVVAACGGDDDSSSGTDTGSGGASTAAAETAESDLLPEMPADADGADVEAARASLLEALTPGEFVPPGGEVDISGLTDKDVIYTIACGGGNLYCRSVAKGIEQGAEAAGVPFETYFAEDPSKNQDGVQRAIAKGAKAIVLVGVDPASIQAPLKSARADGAKVINVVGRSLKDPLAPETDANVTNDFDEEGRVSADYAVATKGGEVNALCGRVPIYPTTRNYCDGFKKRLAELCPDCRYAETNFNVTNLPQEVPAGIQAAIRQNPDLNFLACSIDQVCQYAVPAIQAAGAGDRIIAGSQTGTPSPNLKWVAEGNIQRQDAGVPELWVGWSTVDMALRLMSGQDPTPDAGALPLRFFTTESLSKRPDLKYTADVSAIDEIYETDGGRVYRDAFQANWKGGGQ